MGLPEDLIPYLANNDPLPDNLRAVAKSALEDPEGHSLSDIEKYRLLLSPIRSLPFELIAQIIRARLSMDETILFRRYQRLVFMNLRQVCRAWRLVSFSTPSFWSRVHVDKTDLSLATCPGPRFSYYHLPTQISKWFDRAGNVLLSLIVDTQGCSIADYHSLLTAIVTITQERQRQWTTLSLADILQYGRWPGRIRSHAYDVLYPIRNCHHMGNRNPWHSVQHLSLTVAWYFLGPRVEGSQPCPYDWHFEGDEFFDLFPNLKILKLGSKTTEDTWRLSHPRLTTLIMVFCGKLDSFLLMVKQLPALETLVVKYDPARRGRASTVTRVQLPRVTRFGFQAPEEGLFLLGNLALPKLDELCLSVYRHGTSDGSVPPIFDFFSQSKCPRVLYIANHINAGLLRSILSHRIDTQDIVIRNFRPLCSLDSPHFLPQLRHLRYRVSTNIWPDDYVVRFVQDRKGVETVEFLPFERIKPGERVRVRRQVERLAEMGVVMTCEERGDDVVPHWMEFPR
ncbi:hypothetical protein CC1G_15509 [Coprinopsis cinerea okayama7|uniref:Uncharacterized protein n=1 Tax=Coprinopsis cinerea (strain Okayama-7 / 130 / ATCC MYA-4618 / FGSC 9003) TaxID=240176 RepID=D6RN90_COPC7|nr:hypothetical protein CC1G_15509 [Coprinopsis cinerea okayama7\|eukprot:XP_002910968.1 hypothetical protein CC1G_15509 [Coprinopsis cinerea okayama7\